jgi:hypothetical protein
MSGFAPKVKLAAAFGVLVAVLTFGILAPATAQAPVRRPIVHMGSKPQQILITKITVADLQRSHDFYTRIVGLRPVTSPDMQLPVLPPPGSPEKDFIELLQAPSF